LEQQEHKIPRLRYLSSKDISTLDLSVGDFVDLAEIALREHAAGQTLMPPKLELNLSSAFLHAMPAVVSNLGAGIKWVSYSPTNRTRGLPNSSALLVLNDVESGLPYCVLDALSATYARTAACALVAMGHLSRQPVRIISLVGAGQMAQTLVPFFDEALPELEEFRVLTRGAESARRFRDAMQARLRSPIRVVGGVDEAATGTDVIVSAIGATERPPLGAHHLEPGALALPLDAEIAWETAAFNQADKRYADDAAVFEAGFRLRRPNETLKPLTGELAEVVGGLCPGRERDDERIFCSNNGIAILDVVLGAEIYRRALAQDVGVELHLDD
jgi:ornithine cyclodeaminase/alanine dehydrogenase-like protein (mu-crystallin family)